MLVDCGVGEDSWESLGNLGDQGSIPGWERSPGEGNQNIPLQKVTISQKNIAREEERNKGTTKQKLSIKMALVSPYLLIIAFNVSGLESPIKGGEWLDGLKKLRLIWCWPGGFCSVAQLCQILCDPVDCSTPGFFVLHHLSEIIWVIRVAEDNFFFNH